MIEKKGVVHLNIYPTRCNCKIIFFKKYKNNVEILSEDNIKISMDNRVFMEKTFRENYINKISAYINNERLKYKSCKSVFVNIQESDVILKNIKIDPEIKKKDIIKAVNMEIEEFYTNPFNDYCINYKRIENDNEENDIQVVLFPKKYINLFSEICDRIDMENRAMHTNFDLISRLIKIKGGKVFDMMEQAGVVEFRDEDLAISIFERNQLKYSYVIRKEEFTEELFMSIFSDCVGIMCMGNKEIGDIEILQKFSEYMEVTLDEDAIYTKGDKRVSAQEYFNIAGKFLN